MRKLVVVALVFGTLIGLGAVAEAGKKVKPSKMTCEEFLGVDEQVQPRIVYWIAGYNKAGKLQTEEIELDTISKPIVDSVVEECKKEPKASLSDKIKSKL